MDFIPFATEPINFNIPVINLELVAPNSGNLLYNSNFFRDQILIEQDRLILAPYLYINNGSSNSYHEIKVSAYLDEVPINVQLNTSWTIFNNLNGPPVLLDTNNNNKIDILPIPNTGESGVRFLIYSDKLNDNISEQLLKIEIQEVDGLPTSIIWESVVSYSHCKSQSQDPFYINKDAYHFKT